MFYGETKIKSGRLRPRKGAALVLAMMVAVAGGILIGAMFDMVYHHSFINVEFHMEPYINHTTLLSAVQEMKGRITSGNAAGSKIKHHPGYGYDTGTAPAPGSITLAALPLGDWYVPRHTVVNGVGAQSLEVQVFDLFFESGWIDPDDLANPACPPPFMPLETDAYKDIDKPIDINHVSGDSGYTGDASAAPQAHEYGAYLIRAMLFDGRGSPIHVMEEAFVQVLPRQS